jgi:predicted metal-binding membrane protein
VSVALPASRRRWLPGIGTSVLLALAAAAWMATIQRADDMGGAAPGTMGYGVAAFVGAWTLMMAAMMLPSIAPVAALYTRTFRTDGAVRRRLLLAAGYLAVWAGAGVIAFALAAGADRLAEDAPGWAHAAAVATCMACGIYQVTPIKDRCLEHCRSPLAHLLRFGSFRGPLADVRVGLDHGSWCVACCWSLMLLLVTFGVMNVAVMAVLAAVILVEKVAKPGRWFSVAVGIAAFALAVAVWADASLAPGLHAGATSMGM